MHETQKTTDTQREVLAMRLILAHLQDDPGETAYLVWAILDESGCTREQFDIADRTAREAASWWWKCGPEEAEKGRRRILNKLEQLSEV